MVKDITMKKGIGIVGVGRGGGGEGDRTDVRGGSEGLEVCVG